MKISGVWLPIITPFKNDTVDFSSYKRLIDYYITKGISGLIPLGTTGESPAISDEEYEAIVDKTLEYVHGRVPVFIGLGGNYTKKVLKSLHTLSKYQVDGILSVCPYYNRPDQRGIYQHFQQISEATDLKIIIYNIPYRTGRNIENETIYKLAELKNIVGIKDSCGDIKQSMELLLNPPKDFSILTGEDILYYTTLTLGGDGGILAAAHLKTEEFVSIYQMTRNNNHQEALAKWVNLAEFIPLLFAEPNPAPIKYALHKMGLIDSSEIRLPLVEVSEKMADKLTKVLQL